MPFNAFVFEIENEARRVQCAEIYVKISRRPKIDSILCELKKEWVRGKYKEKMKNKNEFNFPFLNGE